MVVDATDVMMNTATMLHGETADIIIIPNGVFLDHDFPIAKNWLRSGNGLGPAGLTPYPIRIYVKLPHPPT